jgi:hypothetical protein
MTSAINPNNINGAYPVAGQDNDSQGFRDNFTNIKTNFTYASDELTDLQSKVVLKSALNGTTLNNNMAGSPLSNAQLIGVTTPSQALGTVSGDQTLNFAVGSYYTLTTAGSVSIAFSNWPAAGQVGTINLQVTVTNVAYTLTLPSSVTVGVDNLQGFASNVITFNQVGVYEFQFVNSEGPTSTAISVFDLNRNRDPIYLPSSEDLIDAGAIDLGVTTSYFTTSATETATLAAGANGQIKVLAMVGIVGNMVITVTNAGWKSSGTGTITFAAIGRACTLQYINGKWFCIGNNGCTFA